MSARSAARRRRRPLLRIARDGGKRRLLVSMAARALGRTVHVEGEAARGAGGEGQVRDRAWFYPQFDVVAVEVQGLALVRRAAQFDDVALFDPDGSHVLRQTAALDVQVEREFSRDGAAGRHACRES